MHPVFGIPGLCSQEHLFHPLAVFPDGNNKRHLHSGQKPDHLLSIELPVQAEDFDPEAEFGAREIPHLRLPKDSRWDLKQLVLGMATDQHGIPLSAGLHRERIR